MKECNSRFKLVFTKTQLLIFDQSIALFIVYLLLLFIIINRKIRNSEFGIRNSGLIFRESIC